MGGRGQSSTSAMSGGGGTLDASPAELALGERISNDLGVSKEKGVEFGRAINDWANGSSGIKNAQRGSGSFTERDKQNAKTMDEFINAAPDYKGDLVRVINVPSGTKFSKGDKLKGDGSITSWTVPNNYENALHGFGRESGLNVALHVTATKGADTRRYSGLSMQDQEIVEARSYDSGLTVQRTKRKKERTWAFPEGIEVLHVYVKE